MIMDSLASLALATELPQPELLLRDPLKKDDFIVTRKMAKHIIYMSLFQMTILFIFLFGGEYMIPESNEALLFNEKRRALGYTDWKTNDKVFPGRLYTVNGEPLYLSIQKEYAMDDDSRHLTFIFNLFIWLQITNMIATRKINDELNLCKYFWTNPAFICIWFIIVILNFLIVQFTGKFFSLHPTG